jgi:uncharacterized membrane protein
MSEFFLWYIMASITGWLVFPLAFRLLPALPERGYTASRALGLLLWGYGFWLLASLGILDNSPGSLMLVWIVLAAMSGWTLRKGGKARILDWLRKNRGLVLVTEVIFLVAFAAWTFVRAANPEAVGTEKPMELAFINAILGSPTFPPHDPWLSGYAISYYYFGYIIVAMLARITGTAGSVAFNLGIALVFALCAVGAYGLVYNLVAVYQEKHKESNPHRQAAPSLGAPLLGPIFLLLVSNLEGFLHSLYSRGLFWRQDASGNLTSNFWRWLDIKDLNVVPTQPFSWVPQNFWWWWRASRVLQDYDLANNPKEIIDEFPFFSYLLADLHPHVLAMPFALLVIALALNVFLGGGKSIQDAKQMLNLRLKLNLRTVAWIGTLALPLGVLLGGLGAKRLSLMMGALGVVLLIIGLAFLVRMRNVVGQQGIKILIQDNLGQLELGTSLHLSPASFVLAAIALGGMAFLNTWDFPFYVALFAGAYAVERVVAEQRSILSLAGDFIWSALALGACGGLLYLPFYLGFASQAGGILPNLIYITRGAHLWVMFAPLLAPILVFLAYLLRQNSNRRTWSNGLKLALGIFGLLLVTTLLLGLAIVLIPQVGDFYMNFLAASGIDALFQETLLRRLVSPGGWITLLVLLWLTLSVLLLLDKQKPGDLAENPGSADHPALQANGVSESAVGGTLNRSHVFAILLVLLGALLIIGPEFLYLRDQFGWRMNTIFKFYFQAWLLWSIAAAYVSVVLFKSLRRGWGYAFRLGWVILLSMSLVYPLFSLWNKTNGFSPSEWTLDSSAYLNSQSPDEAAAIEWLKTAPFGVLAEGVPPGGGSYTDFARFATLSGKPDVLGWYGHESQWRGGGDLLSPRQADLESLYCGRDWDETQIILERYQVRYIILGPLERSTYRPGERNCPSGIFENKFTRYLKVAFKVGQVTIYEVPIEASAVDQQ